MQKQWYKSWTIWFNIGMLAVGAINELATIIPISKDIMIYAAVFGNILLRFKTTMEIILAEK